LAADGPVADAQDLGDGLVGVAFEFELHDAGLLRIEAADEMIHRVSGDEHEVALGHAKVEEVDLVEVDAPGQWTVEGVWVGDVEGREAKASAFLRDEFVAAGDHALGNGSAQDSEAGFDVFELVKPALDGGFEEQAVATEQGVLGRVEHLGYSDLSQIGLGGSEQGSGVELEASCEKFDQSLGGDGRAVIPAGTSVFHELRPRSEGVSDHVLCTRTESSS